MNRSLEQVFRGYPRPYLTHAEIEVLLDKTPDSRYARIKRMLAQGSLLHIRRGLYCITETVGYFKKPHPFELAQYIYGPSYISLESALNYHQLIPEGVYTTTSVVGKRSKEFKTPLGIFSYRQVPLENLYTMVDHIEKNQYQFFIARPWKAICDYIFCYRKKWNSLEPLLKSLRIDVENLPMLRDTEVQLLDAFYHKTHISQFLMGIKKELNQAMKFSEM